MKILDRILQIGLMLLICTVAVSAIAESKNSLPTLTVEIETQQGLVPLTLELAVNDETRIRGLMRRASIGPHDGMLFVFQDAEPRSFWMKDTSIPLDIIFFDGEGYVIQIAKHTTPYSLAAIPSGGAAGNVIELAAGRADALGIAPGDRLIYELPAGVYVE